jgi:hypothetical protein
MTGYLKLALLAIFAFAAPVGFALLVSPFLFEEAFTKEQIAVRPSDLIGANSSVVYQEDIDKPEHGSARWHARIDGASELDPHQEDLFLVSFLVRFEELPSEKLRHNIIEKYETSTRPYAGWAVGVQRINDRVRPQVYWRDSKGQGGWFTFESVELVPKQWYCITLVARDSEYLSLYSQRMFIKKEPKADVGVKFLGGHSLKEISTPKTRANVSLGVVRSNGKSFQGDFGYVVIARPNNLPEDIDSLLEYLAGGAARIRDKLGSADLLLSINEKWQDDSRLQHRIERS